jgi:hypothetical protein
VEEEGEEKEGEERRESGRRERGRGRGDGGRIISGYYHPPSLRYRPHILIIFNKKVFKKKNYLK